MIAIMDGHIKSVPTCYADRESVDFSISVTTGDCNSRREIAE